MTAGAATHSGVGHADGIQGWNAATRADAGSSTQTSNPAFSSVDARYHLTEDLYVILSAFERDGGSTLPSGYHQSMISWIWIGGVVILLGCLFAVLPDDVWRCLLPGRDAGG